MRIISAILVFFVLTLNVYGQKGWVRYPVEPKEVVCYGSGIVEKGFTPPPGDVIYRLKSGSAKTCEINVTYSGFPDSVKIAFEYAVSIWEQLLESDVPVNISASWKVMSKNTLASCGPSGYYRNLDGMYFTDRYYAVAIAEKIYGKEITGAGSPDMTASFNKSIEWYYGTDGETPIDRYDFVSTVLHELAHGLGFTGFFEVGSGTAGFDDPPAIFDQYLSNLSKQFLIDGDYFNNPSVNLYKAVTSNALYFRSPAAITNNGGAIPKLYAPVTFDEGSSIYHLNDFSYPAGTANSLMTHAAGFGEATHDPGPITMGILADIGWKNMVIKHDTLKDIETVVAPVLIEASIVSDFNLDSTLLYVIYSTNFFESVDSVLMVADEKATYFKAELPVTITSGVVSYYISATDEKRRTFTKPNGAPQDFFKFRVGPDNISPTIAHQHKDYILFKLRNLNISAFVNENIGIDSVWIEYFLNSGNVASQGLKNDSASVYSTGLNLSNWDLKEDDTISYKIVARDISSNHNTTYLPPKGNFSVAVKESFDPVSKYSNTFNESSNDFVSSDFEIKTASGFIDGALHGPHPYASPEQNDMYYNYTALLRYPIILADGGTINFDEIVLVEPGEDGTVYGDEEFWDYVIVEGSDDFGETWLPLADGYDSKNNQAWNVEYNNGINDDGNSETVGTKEMFIRKNLNMVENGNFIAGDTICIRFRLFSDPFAHGWGWVIDNLRIQSIVSAPAISVSPGDFRVYPNPSTGRISVEYFAKQEFGETILTVSDIFGKKILSEPAKQTNSGFKNELDIETYPPGLYLIQAFTKGERILSRKVVKQ